MAPWIIHLRIAEDLSRLLHRLDKSYFSIGSIAPDSGFRSSIDDEFDPPSFVSHFYAPEGAKYPIADLHFFNDHLSTYAQRDYRFRWPTIRLAQPYSDKFSFLLGYYFHLVTDILWFEEVDKPTRERFQKEFEADPAFIWDVKRDWYGLDLDYVRKHPQFLFWTIFVKARYESDFLPFLKPHAIQTRIDEIVELYQRMDDEIEDWYGRRPDKYLSKEEYDLFVVGTCPLLMKCYELLFVKRISVEGRLSILEIVL